LNKNPAFKERGPVIQYRKHWRSLTSIPCRP
jgi:hypothetical protein